MLVPAKPSDAPSLLALQERAFAALYQTYGDPYNPAIESLDYLLSRFQRPGCVFYFIHEGGQAIGLIRVTVAQGVSTGWLGLIGLDPAYRGRGYASQALLDLERLYPRVTTWQVCTILQEPSLVRFYQGLGYRPIKTVPEYKGSDKVYDLVYMEKSSKEVD